MNEVLGFIGVVVAILCFGTFIVPVKFFETGDGVFFQWIQCCSIFLVGLIVEVAVGSPYRFEPIAMLGGMFWCLGNAMVVPTVDCIGLSLGMLLWGTVNMLTGWFAGHFGLVVAKEEAETPVLNYIGIMLAAISVFLYFPIKPSNHVDSTDNESEPLIHLIDNPDNSINSGSNKLLSSMTTAKKPLGIGMAIAAGFLYGINMLPVSYLQQHNPSAAPLAFAMSHFAGIFATSTVLLVIYCLFKKNKPEVYPQAILPGVVAGILWATAQSGWFIGNANLGLTVSYPLICTGPGIVASLWGVFLFKEIQGSRNFMWLVGAFVIAVIGISLITLSKIKF